MGHASSTYVHDKVDRTLGFFSCEPAPCGFRRFSAAAGQLAAVWVGLNACFTFHRISEVANLIGGRGSSQTVSCATVCWTISEHICPEVGLGHPERRRQTGEGGGGEGGGV